jgi:RNA polymerase sigma factor (sigma-70 family)
VGDRAEALFLEHRQLVEQIIRFVCRRRGMRGDEAEEFASTVRLRLVESGYDIFRKFQGRSSLHTYLTVVIQHMAIDFRAARWGKWRASAIARSGGPAAVRLEQLVVRDGMPVADAVRQLEVQFPGEVDGPALQRIAERLPLRTRRQYVGEELLEYAASQAPDAERILVMAAEQERFERLAGQLKAFISGLEPSDRVALQMKFEQGMRVADIARLLQCDQKRLYRSIDHALARLRAMLEAEGVRASDVRGLLAATEEAANGGKSEPPVRLLEKKTP